MSTLDYILLGALMIFILGCCATMWVISHTRSKSFPFAECFRKTIIARFAYSDSSEDKREPFLSLNSEGSNTHLINSPGSGMRSDTPTRVIPDFYFISITHCSQNINPTYCTFRNMTLNARISVNF